MPRYLLALAPPLFPSRDMPRRNLYVIVFAALIAAFCYGRAARNRYSDTFAQAMNFITRDYVDEVEPPEAAEPRWRQRNLNRSPVRGQPLGPLCATVDLNPDHRGRGLSGCESQM